MPGWDLWCSLGVAQGGLGGLQALGGGVDGVLGGVFSLKLVEGRPAEERLFVQAK